MHHRIIAPRRLADVVEPPIDSRSANEPTAGKIKNLTAASLVGLGFVAATADEFGKIIHRDFCAGQGKSALEYHGMRGLFGNRRFPVFSGCAQHETPGGNHDQLRTILTSGQPIRKNLTRLLALGTVFGGNGVNRYGIPFTAGRT